MSSQIMLEFTSSYYFGIQGTDGLLLTVACASCGTEASVVSSCLGDVLAPSKEWRANFAGSEGSGESVEP